MRGERAGARGLAGWLAPWGGTEELRARLLFQCKQQRVRRKGRYICAWGRFGSPLTYANAEGGLHAGEAAAFEILNRAPLPLLTPLPLLRLDPK